VLCAALHNTYCSTWSGIVYVAFVVDMFSRRIVGWKAARTMHASLVVDALNMAAWTRRGTSLDGVICHSDAGSQLRFNRSSQRCLVRPSVEAHRGPRRVSSSRASCGAAC